MNQQQVQQRLVSKSLWRLGRSVLCIYVALGAFAYFFADRLIFSPPAASYAENADLLNLTSVDGTQIAARYLPHPTATHTILFSHGNAEDLGEILPTLELLQAAGFTVFAYDYQSYGISQGRPSEQNAYEDVEAAYRYLTNTLGILPQQIISHRRSVGGGAAIALATRKPVAGLIVESSFTSAFTVITRFPLYPFDKLPNLTHIRQV
jgi:hypothetical protein